MSPDGPHGPTPPEVPAPPPGATGERPPALVLEVIAGESPGARIEVEDELLIGRLTGGPGELSDDEVSREHARISREQAGGYAIEDLGSSNGTFVNGSRLAAPRLLVEEDLIEVGATNLLVKEIGRSASTTFGSVEQSALPPTAPLTLNLQVDFGKREASVEISTGGEPVCLRLIDGRWQQDGRSDVPGSEGTDA